ncbi:hypothetical protein [Streptomyces sp. NPDC002490]|uniref:hypothetical protein n=1 Tax=Streptomyces sp. NPDC002490 TaxID=3154416 RepID=UPI00331EE80A
MREWHFILHADAPLTDTQSNVRDHLECFNDGRISLVEGPGTAEFWCAYEAESLTDAVGEALALFVSLTGVLVRSVELGPRELAENGMATSAVVPAPG